MRTGSNYLSHILRDPSPYSRSIKTVSEGQRIILLKPDLTYVNNQSRYLVLSVGYTFPIGWGLAGVISEGIALGSVLLLIGGSGMMAHAVSNLQSNSTVLDDRLELFTVAMVVLSVFTATWFLP